MKIEKNLAGKLLAAQLFRLVESDGANPLKLRSQDFTLHASSVMRGIRHIAFSGAFLNNDRMATLPFTIAFSRAQHGVRAIPAQFAAAGIRSPRSHTLAFCSVIDFMESIGELSRADGLSEHIGYVTKGGTIPHRAAICAEYASFRERSIKALPYDDSLLLLGEAA
jgi:hypothetical protein